MNTTQTKVTRVTVPPRFADDWMDSCGGWTINAAKDPEGTFLEEVRRTQTSLTLDLGPVALRDLKERAEYYLLESFEPEYRGLVASARATLNRLRKDGHIQ